MITIAEIVEALEKSGYDAKAAQGKVQVKLGKRYLGYVTVEDDGTTGTCQHVQRAGDIARILRTASAR